MTRRRWIADEVSGNRAALTGAHAAHLIRVLRVRIGQEFDIAAEGQVRPAKVTAISPAADRVEFELGQAVETSQSANVTLLLAIFKFDRMEWAIEKCTELGVSRIVPVIAMRTDIHLAKTADKRVERWRRIAVQASEQSRRDAIPVIDTPAKISRELLSNFAGTRIVLAESEKETAMRALIDPLSKTPVTLAVGPEGGWTSAEMKTFAECGWSSASLGQTILRAETAAIASLAVVILE
jgi:16S rRNA (uracil1498-N3)-methyltransferase